MHFFSWARSLITFSGSSRCAFIHTHTYTDGKQPHIYRLHLIYYIIENLYKTLKVAKRNKVTIVIFLSNCQNVKKISKEYHIWRRNGVEKSSLFFTLRHRTFLGSKFKAIFTKKDNKKRQFGGGFCLCKKSCNIKISSIVKTAILIFCRGNDTLERFTMVNW